MSPLEGEPPAVDLPDGRPSPVKRPSQTYSGLARAAIMSSLSSAAPAADDNGPISRNTKTASMLMPPTKTALGRLPNGHNVQKQSPLEHRSTLGVALTDTPVSSTPGSPQIHARNALSGSSTPKIRATTLDIPGLTKSKVSPDGRIAQRDAGAKLIIIMVGLPARGKSYVVKKITRYLNWLQHPTRIFNVGDRRRIAAGTGGKPRSVNGINSILRESIRTLSIAESPVSTFHDQKYLLGLPAIAPDVHVHSPSEASSPASQPNLQTYGSTHSRGHAPRTEHTDLPPPMDQSATFFDPKNKEAFQVREDVAYETMEELLRYVLEEGGSVGIHDATNSTRERRINLMKQIRTRDPNINVLFLESFCKDRKLLDANKRLKLSGPDYKNKDPQKAFEDFERRIEMYEREYARLDEYEEEHGMSYCSMIDVGRKIISHQVRGFLSIQTVTYLMNFNLAPRQIWLTRHGESVDNVNGRIGGDSPLTPAGLRYAQALERFVTKERAAWEVRQLNKQANIHFPPRAGDTTPPNPEVGGTEPSNRNFCVWTSMLLRSTECAQFFKEDDYETKEWRMLDELNAGYCEGMTYEEIKAKYPKEFELRKRDKLHYRYPGPGGEGYLDIINRLGKIILEIERMTDHVLIIGHRSIVRVLLAYFKGLEQKDIGDLDVPLGVVYILEPRPYGVDFRSYSYDDTTDSFAPLDSA